MFTERKSGIAPENVIPTDIGTMVRLTLLLCEGLLVTVAVIVMAALMGMAEGAVYVVDWPSDVCERDKVPQAPLVMLPVTGLPPQETTQSTPASMLSPAGIILNFTVEVMASAVKFPETPLALVMRMDPALAWEEVVPPQPVIIRLDAAKYSTKSRLRAPRRRGDNPSVMNPTAFLLLSSRFRMRFSSMNRISLIPFCP